MVQKKPSDHNKRPGLPARLIEDFRLLFLLIADFIKGEYRQVPVWSIIVLMFALGYVFSPFDIIPDYLPGYGQIDDILVAFSCLYFLEKDLYTYKKWKNKQSRELK